MLKAKAEKVKLRNEYLHMRKTQDPEKKHELDIELQSRLLSLPEYNKAAVIFTYIARNDEVETRGIISAAFANGKTVAVPKCSPDGRNLDFYFIKSFRQIDIGKFGIYEPLTAVCERVSDFEKGLCIVPGMAFDAEGYRLGYGKGFYDSFLKKFGGITIGMAPTSNIRYKLPRESHDEKVQILISEKYIRKTQESD